MVIRLNPKFAAMTALSVALCNIAAFADVSWDSVKQKVASSNNYDVTYRYAGPKGTFKFNYRVNTPEHIRTEILEGSDASRVGTVLVYDASWNKDKVRAKTGGGVIARNLTHKDVEGTPFYQPVFEMIVKQTGGATPVEKKDGSGERFDFKTGGGSYTVWTNGAGDITKTERLDGRERETREFSNIKYNSNPKTSF